MLSLRSTQSAQNVHSKVQIFRVLRPTLANRIFATLGELERALTEQLQRFWDQPPTLKRLTGYPWWIAAVTSLSSNP